VNDQHETVPRCRNQTTSRRSLKSADYCGMSPITEQHSWTRAYLNSSDNDKGLWW